MRIEIERQIKHSERSFETARKNIDIGAYEVGEKMSSPMTSSRGWTKRGP